MFGALCLPGPGCGCPGPWVAGGVGLWVPGAGAGLRESRGGVLTWLDERRKTGKVVEDRVPKGLGLWS